MLNFVKLVNFSKLSNETNISLAPNFRSAIHSAFRISVFIFNSTTLRLDGFFLNLFFIK